MSPQSESWIAASRLVRRTGFGATGGQVDAALKLGATAYVQTILANAPDADVGAKATPIPTFASIGVLGKGASVADRHRYQEQIRLQVTALTSWWVRRMVAVQEPFGEKLTFCWHDHFATSATKVRSADWLLAQNERLRHLGRGNFRTLALAMLTDAAMLFWLDGVKNTSAAPNENLSREFMELFALGHSGGYTENDVREGARALTGWKIKPDGSTYLKPAQHDSGTKTFLGVKGNLDVTGYCDAVLARPASAEFLAGRWWGQLASDTTPPSTAVSGVSAAYGAQRDLSAMFSSMLTRPEFAAAQGSLVIGPVEWLIGAVRTLNVPVRDDAAAAKLLGVLRGLGQVPFYPANVSGWPSGQAWLSTAAADARMRAALALAQTGDLSSVSRAATTDRLDAVGYLLGVGRWSPRTAAVLHGAVSDPIRLVAIALNTREYLVH